MAKELLSYMTKEPIAYLDSELPFLYKLLGFHKPVSPKDRTFDGEIVVLTDGAGFSTTAHFCALAKYHKLAKLVGNETGGGSVCTDASKDSVLKNTKLRLHYSTRVFRVKTKGEADKHGVKPDVFVPQTTGDLLMGNDAVMEAGLEALSNGVTPISKPVI
jgi:C-terminal processing protease CtpA/Prc